MDRKYDYMIIDGHNLYHRAYHANKELTHHVDGKRIITGGVYGFLNSLRKLKKDYLLPGGYIYILFDNFASSTEIRKKIDPQYKSNRPKLPRSFYRGVEILQLILLRFDSNMSIVYRHHYEADDLVETVLAKFPKELFSLIVSTDMDWSRSIRTNVHWLKGNELYDIKAFMRKYNFRPSIKTVSMYKTFKGDKVDNIPPGLSGIKTETVIKILERYSDIFDFLHDSDSGNVDFLSETWMNKLRDPKVRHQLVKNFELVSFQGHPDDTLNDNIFECSFNDSSKKTLRILYESLGFNVNHFDPRLKEDVLLNELLGWDVPQRA